jgi:translocator protein
MWNNPPGRNVVGLVGFLAASFAAAGLGSAFSIPALDPWYRELRKPAWTPPDQVFGPVWTILYFQMAVAAWLVHRHTTGQRGARSSRGKVAFFAWVAQLLLNVGWSAAFFGLRSPAAGLLTIVPLWVAVVAAVATAARVTRVASLLLVPYLAWTSFAAALNLRIWQLNRTSE